MGDDQRVQYGESEWWSNLTQVKVLAFPKPIGECVLCDTHASY
jgi:hypothetical protein